MGDGLSEAEGRKEIPGCFFNDPDSTRCICYWQRGASGARNTAAGDVLITVAREGEGLRHRQAGTATQHHHLRRPRWAPVALAVRLPALPASSSPLPPAHSQALPYRSLHRCQGTEWAASPKALPGVWAQGSPHPPLPGQGSLANASPRGLLRPLLKNSARGFKSGLTRSPSEHPKSTEHPTFHFLPTSGAVISQHSAALSSFLVCPSLPAEGSWGRGGRPRMPSARRKPKQRLGKTEPHQGSGTENRKQAPTPKSLHMFPAVPPGSVAVPPSRYHLPLRNSHT